MLRACREYEQSASRVPKCLLKWQCSSPKLFQHFLNQHLHTSDVLYQVIWDRMSLRQVFWTIVGNPNSSLTVLRNQNLKREIDGDAGSGHHHRRPTFRAAKDEELGGTHFQSHLF